MDRLSRCSVSALLANSLCPASRQAFPFRTETRFLEGTIVYKAEESDTTVPALHV